MKALKIYTLGNVLIQADEVNVWIEVWKEEGEIVADWNQYIFNLNCKEDLKVKKFQERNDNFDEATSVAISYYEQQTKKL